MNFIFVILHYKTYDDTKECIESILDNVQYLNKKIVVVDNGSKNDTGETLMREYKNNSNVDVIISEENLGFANGNNLGCDFAIKKYNPDFLCVINNDTLISQNDFVEKCIEKYKISEFDILGPDILTKDGKHQNPHNSRLDSLKKIRQQKRIIRKLMILDNDITNFVRPFLKKIKMKLKKNFKTSSGRIEADVNFKTERINVTLHGSALIFSKKYIKKYGNIFYNKTFMYCEEDILNYFRIRDGLLVIYYPEVKIFHKEDASTDLILGKGIKKRRFFYKHSLNSLNELEKLMLIGVRNDLK